MDKKIEELEKRIKELEDKQNHTSNMFGRAYAQVGSSNSDFLIKTKGQVKIQWGSKFIDLIKDGKINVDANFVFTAKNAEKLGVKDGLYVTDDEAVYLKIGGTALNLVGEVGTTYVSFLESQETTPEQKYTAMQNIGLVYKDLSSISANSLKNGIIYVESDQKLYIVQEGTLSEFKLSFPNSFTEQFIIAKSGDAKGALLIKGTGINNSLAFEKLFIYNESGNSYIDSDGAIYFRIGSVEKISIEDGGVTFLDPVIASMFQSDGATESSGFRLYIKDGRSTLEIDNLIVRNSNDSSDSFYPIFPVQWYSKNNIIKSIQPAISIDDTNKEGYYIQLGYENEYQIGDSLYAYTILETEKGSKQVKISFTIDSLDTKDEGAIYANLTDGAKNTLGILEVSEEDLLHGLSGQIIFLVGSQEGSRTILRRSESGIDLVRASNFKEEADIKSICSRVGDLTELGLKESSAEMEVDVTGFGIYSEQAYFKKAKYITPYNLPEDDDSGSLASTEWVRKILRNTLPVGTIVAYHGDSIPAGWAICDGTNGTPNLIGKFIVANGFEEDGDEIEITSLDAQVGEDLLRVKISPTYYSLIFIMKIQ